MVIRCVKMPSDISTVTVNGNVLKLISFNPMPKLVLEEIFSSKKLTYLRATRVTLETTPDLLRMSMPF
jgi:hypothetical protein